jgi:hypothetical protein
MSRTKRGARAEVDRLAERVRRAVDEGADTVEEIHKKVVNLPLNVLERNGVLENTVKDLRRFQDRTIGAVYDLVRGVNRDVAKLAREVLGPPPATARKPRARRRPAKKVERPKKTEAA